MRIELYNPEDFQNKDIFFLFLSQIYGSNDNVDFFITEYERAYKFCCESKHIKFLPMSFFEDEKMVAHIALIIDDRLPAHQAFFGFFEIIKDKAVFDLVWKEILKCARKNNINLLKGPVNGSIWHQYRCIKGDSTAPYFKTEPMTPFYYYNFLSGANPLCEITYSSGMRKSYEAILKTLKHYHQRCENDEFNVLVTEKITKDILLGIEQLSTTAFNERSWGFTKLEKDEFYALYNVNKINDQLNKLFLLYKKEELIGYCSTMKQGLNLICKTICIDPEFQGKGLGNLLALRIHEEAQRENVEKISYVLVKDANQVHNFPTDDIETFRTYAVFDYKI